MARRILVTGSRTWTRDDVIYRALAAQRHPTEPVILVHGKAPGADLIADHWARQFDARSPREPAVLAEWIEEMHRTHRQVRCPGCGLWKLWVPREG